MAALREKSVALTELFAALVDARCAGMGLTVVSPREAALRGSQVCLTHAATAARAATRSCRRSSRAA